jgi:membrane protein DedA with SNARE-associated domain
MSELIEQLRIWIEGVILWLGYAGIAFVMFLETVFPPIPSEMVMPFAGLLAADGKMNLIGVILAGTVGAVAGAMLLYGVGALVKLETLRGFVRKYGKFAMVTEADLDRSFVFFNLRGEVVVFFGRLIMLVRSLISLPAGVVRMSIPKFLFFSALGTGLWNVLLAGIGYVLGENWKAVIEVIDYWEEVIFIGLVVAAVGFIVGRKLLANRRAKRA